MESAFLQGAPPGKALMGLVRQASRIELDPAGPSARARCCTCALLRARLVRGERQGSIHIRAPNKWRQARRANVASADRGATDRATVLARRYRTPAVCTEN